MTLIRTPEDFSYAAAVHAARERNGEDGNPDDKAVTSTKGQIFDGDIARNGAFSCGIEQRGTDVEATGIGSYSGLFGGDRASAVAGMVTLDGNFIEDVENEFEYGIFVLDRCQRGTPACEVVTNP